MKPPLIESPELSDADLEAIAVEAILYRIAARAQFVVAGLLRAAGHRGGYRWHVCEGMRFVRESGRRDGRGTDEEWSL